MADRKGAGGEPRPALRIAGYVQGHAEPVAGPEPAAAPTESRPAPAGVPNIADYWPDAPGERPTVTVSQPAPPSDVVNFGAPDRAVRKIRPAVVAAALAVLVAVGALLLTRPMSRMSQESAAAPATSAVSPTTAAPVVIAPTSSPAAPPSSAPPAVAPSPPAAATTPPPHEIRSARFELVTGAGELAVRTADLGGDEFRVSTPKNSGIDVNAVFRDGTLRVSTKPDGAESGSGRVDVLLSKDIVWRLRMGAGVRTASFDMAGGTVEEIDLIGGVRTVDLSLGRLDRTLPILMAGGVRTWRISTATEVPVRIALSTGAGAVTVYGDDKGGVRGGSTLRFGDRDDRPGLDIDAEAGIGSLKITDD